MVALWFCVALTRLEMDPDKVMLESSRDRLCYDMEWDVLENILLVCPF